MWYEAGSRLGKSLAVVRVKLLMMLVPRRGVTIRPVPSRAVFRYLVLEVPSIDLVTSSPAGEALDDAGLSMARILSLSNAPGRIWLPPALGASKNLVSEICIRVEVAVRRVGK